MQGRNQFRESGSRCLNEFFRRTRTLDCPPETQVINFAWQFNREKRLWTRRTETSTRQRSICIRCHRNQRMSSYPRVEVRARIHRQDDPQDISWVERQHRMGLAEESYRVHRRTPSAHLFNSTCFPRENEHLVLMEGRFVRQSSRRGAVYGLSSP